ncbi:MAG: hypothetical protein OEQ25_10595 [Gammaproteobacteria bacterium]|nr:hypothetical protein [Gammaproteobacteria bacterium]
MILILRRRKVLLTSLVVAGWGGQSEVWAGSQDGLASLKIE